MVWTKISNGSIYIGSGAWKKHNWEHLAVIILEINYAYA